MTPKKYEKVEDAVKAMFDSLRRQFLPKEDKRLTFSYQSLGELYEQSVRAAGGIPDPETRANLEEIADTYLTAAETRTIANLKHVVNVVRRAKAHDAMEALPDVQEAVEDTIDRASTEVERIVDTESQRARAVGAWEGINQAAAQMGIDDPTVFFVVVRDESLCGECKRLHLLPNEITPRVWKMSELNHDYHDRGGEYPSVQGLHPHCRCSKTILFPGWGFDSSGMVKYISPDYDEFAKQRE
jgi:hypothetical protein